MNKDRSSLKMTATSVEERTIERNRVRAEATTATLSLAELLRQSIEEDPTTEEPLSKRWDDDEGSSGG